MSTSASLFVLVVALAVAEEPASPIAANKIDAATSPPATEAKLVTWSDFMEMVAASAPRRFSSLNGDITLEQVDYSMGYAVRIRKLASSTLPAPHPWDCELTETLDNALLQCRLLLPMPAENDSKAEFEKLAGAYWKATGDGWAVAGKDESDSWSRTRNTDGLNFYMGHGEERDYSDANKAGPPRGWSITFMASLRSSVKRLP